MTAGIARASDADAVDAAETGTAAAASNSAASKLKASAHSDRVGSLEMRDNHNYG